MKSKEKEKLESLRKKIKRIIEDTSRKEVERQNKTYQGIIFNPNIFNQLTSNEK